MNNLHSNRFFHFCTLRYNYRLTYFPFALMIRLDCSLLYKSIKRRRLSDVVQTDMIRLLKVSGNSLYPEYKDGDFVLVSKIPILFRRLHPGDAVAFRQPKYGTMIKKIAYLSPDGGEIIVLGSHPWSTDSRSFGPIRRGAILGKVIAHFGGEL